MPLGNSVKNSFNFIPKVRTGWLMNICPQTDRYLWNYQFSSSIHFIISRTEIQIFLKFCIELEKNEINISTEPIIKHFLFILVKSTLSAIRESFASSTCLFSLYFESEIQNLACAVQLFDPYANRNINLNIQF